MSLRTQTTKGVMWSALEKWGVQFINYAIFVALSRLLIPDDFGLVAMATVFTALVQVFVDQGFGQAIIQSRHLEKDYLDTAFWTSLFTGAMMTLAGWILSGTVAGLYNEPRLNPVLKIMSLGFVISGLSGTQRAILLRDLAFRSLAKRTLIASIAGGVVGTAMAFSGYGVWSLVGRQLVSNIAGVLVLWRASTWRPKLRYNTTHLRVLWGFGLYIAGSQLMDFLNRRSDDFLIGYFLGPTALGYYTIAYRLLLMLTDFFIGFMSNVAIPTFAKLQDDHIRLLRGYYKWVGLATALAAPAFIGVGAIAPSLVPLIYSSQWMKSIPVMQVLCIVGILHSILYFNAALFISLGRPVWRFRLTTLNALFSIPMFLIAVRWGIIAVAVAYVARAYLLSPLNFWAFKMLIPEFRMRTLLQQVAPSLIAVGVMVVSIYLADLSLGSSIGLLPLVIVQVSAGALVYVGVLTLLSKDLVLEAFGLLRTVRTRSGG